MGNNIYIQIKAALLLLVFGLNTIVGFACAVGVDMGFNNAHHHKEAAAEIHVHKDGKAHEHKKHTHSHDANDKDSKDNCCKDSVVKFSLSDKSIPQSNIAISPLFFTAFVTAYYYADLIIPPPVTRNRKYFVRSHHPPIPDIRIAIQSFQI